MSLFITYAKLTECNYTLFETRFFMRQSSASAYLLSTCLLKFPSFNEETENKTGLKLQYMNMTFLFF